MVVVFTVSLYVTVFKASSLVYCWASLLVFSFWKGIGHVKMCHCRRSERNVWWSITSSFQLGPEEDGRRRTMSALPVEQISTTTAFSLPPSGAGTTTCPTPSQPKTHPASRAFALLKRLPWTCSLTIDPQPSFLFFLLAQLPEVKAGQFLWQQ